MEYISRGDLSRYAASGIPEAEIKEIAENVLRGLEVMHREGFTHRDIKPQVCKSTSCFVTDSFRTSLCSEKNQNTSVGGLRLQTLELANKFLRIPKLPFTQPWVLGRTVRRKFLVTWSTTIRRLFTAVKLTCGRSDVSYSTSVVGANYLFLNLIW